MKNTIKSILDYCCAEKIIANISIGDSFNFYCDLSGQRQCYISPYNYWKEGIEILNSPTLIAPLIKKYGKND